jgi:hypothetical protein
VTPLYIKDLSDTTFSSDPSYEYSLPVEASTQIEYPTGPTVLISETSRVCKLTKHGNVIVDSALINEVYNSFYYIESENAIVTHDSIGGIKCQ